METSVSHSILMSIFTCISGYRIAGFSFTQWKETISSFICYQPPILLYDELGVFVVNCTKLPSLVTVRGHIVDAIRTALILSSSSHRNPGRALLQAFGENCSGNLLITSDTRKMSNNWKLTLSFWPLLLLKLRFLGLSAYLSRNHLKLNML